MTEPTLPDPAPQPEGPRDSLGPGHRVGPYQLEELLGRGGMGEVYRARHETTGATYALKLIRSGAEVPDAEMTARFRREAQVLARIDDHPGIVRMHSFGTTEQGHLYCVMELVDGMSLKEVLDADGPLPAQKAARLIGDAAEAIAHANFHGVLHRDLKPANILLGPDGTPRVLDFGLAHDAAATRLTQTGEVFGTPAYMAPEQISPEPGEAISPATDVWGLGATLYALLTGHPPFKRGSPREVMLRVLTQHPRPPSDLVPDLPGDLEAVCLKALEKAPARRYGGAAALADDLDRWQRGEPVTAHTLGPTARLVRRLLPARGPRRRVALSALLVLTALTVTLVGYVGQREMAARQERDSDEKIAAIAELPAALKNATLRNLEGVLRADEIEGRLASLGVNNQGMGEEREVLHDLNRVAKGDVEFLRGANLMTGRWKTHGLALMGVLVATRNGQGLMILLESDDRFFDEKDPQILDMLIEALLARQFDQGPGIIKRLDELLIKRLGELLADKKKAPAPAVRGRVSAARRRLLCIWLEDILATKGEVDRKQLREALQRLTPLVRTGHLPPATAGIVAGSVSSVTLHGGKLPLTQPAIDRLLDLSFSEIDASREETFREENLLLGPLFEITFRALGENPERPRRLLETIGQQIIYLYNNPSGRREDGDSQAWLFRLGLLLQRLGALPDGLRRLVQLAEKTPEYDLKDRLKREVSRGDDLSPGDLFGAFYVLMVRAEAGLPRGSRRSQHRAQFVQAHWDSVLKPILHREAQFQDVPPWVLSHIGGLLERTRPRDRDLDLARDVIAASGGEPKVQDPWIPAATWLLRTAFQREARVPKWRRRIEVAYEYLRLTRIAAGRDPMQLDHAVRLACEVLDWTTHIPTRDMALQDWDSRLSGVALEVSRIADELQRDWQRKGCERCDAVLQLGEAAQEALGTLPIGWQVESRHMWSHGAREEAAAYLAEKLRRCSLGKSKFTACIELATWWNDLGRYDDARAALKRSEDSEVLMSGRADWEDLEKRAQALEKVHDPERAARDYRHAADIVEQRSPSQARRLREQAEALQSPAGP